jgi:hypothetical protein
MTDYVEHKRLESLDGLRAITVEEGDHGLCRFVTWRLYDPAPDIPEQSALTWVPDRFSGLYENLEQAEAAARSEIDWLRS